MSERDINNIDEDFHNHVDNTEMLKKEQYKAIKEKAIRAVHKKDKWDLMRQLGKE